MRIRGRGLRLNGQRDHPRLQEPDAKQFKDVLVLYRYRLDQAGEQTSQLTVPYSEAIGKNRWKQLRPLTSPSIHPAATTCSWPHRRKRS